jgi:hypothetical protein
MLTVSRSSGNCANRFFDLLAICDFDQVPSCSGFHRPAKTISKGTV